MRSISLLVALAAFAAASPFPQDLPIDAIIEAGPPPNVTVPVDGASSEQISYDPSAVISETVAFVTADPLPQRKRSLQKRSATCTPLPAGSGPVPTPDTPSAFLAYSAFAAAASQAPAPAGYVQTFQNLQASNNANGYLGYKSLTTYDVSACAKACDGVKGCSAFNIYFERDPALAPGADCLNPNSTTVIKCVYWGGPVTAENAVNKGQWRNNFQVVIAGSNGYVNQTVTNVPGYKGTFLNNAAVNAPLDCNGNDTYMGYKLFNDGAPFDATRCAAACDAQSAYNIAHPPQSGPPKICRFFNTYLMEKNGLSQGQMCSMYTLAWDSSYAVNTGQTRGTDVYSIAYSYSFYNTTDTATPVCPADITYLQANGAAFCSSYISYTPPVTTSTVATTPPTSTFATTTVITTTSIITDVAFVTTQVIATVSAPAKRGLRRSAGIPTPASITAWPANKIASACSMVATGINTAIATSTAPQPVVTSIETDYYTVATTVDLTSTVTIVSTTTLPAAPSIIVNPSFETGDLTGWNIMSEGNPAPTFESPGTDGNYAIRFQQTQIGDMQVISQTLSNATQGNWYRIDVDWKYDLIDDQCWLAIGGYQWNPIMARTSPTSPYSTYRAQCKNVDVQMAGSQPNTWTTVSGYMYYPTAAQVYECEPWQYPECQSNYPMNKFFDVMVACNSYTKQVIHVDNIRLTQVQC